MAMGAVRLGYFVELAPTVRSGSQSPYIDTPLFVIPAKAGTQSAQRLKPEIFCKISPTGIILLDQL